MSKVNSPFLSLSLFFLADGCPVFPSVRFSKSIGEAEREISELRQSLNSKRITSFLVVILLLLVHWYFADARIDGTTTAQQVTQDLQALRRHKTQQDEKLHTAELALSEAENVSLMFFHRALLFNLIILTFTWSTSDA